MMKTRSKFVGWLIVGMMLVFGLAPGASAGTLTGASGLITLPSADSLANGEIEATVRYVDGRVVASAAYGLLGDIEIAVNNFENSEPLGVGLVLKGTVVRESASSPGVALGLETGQSYVVISKRLIPRLRAHAALVFGATQGFGGGLTYTLQTASVSGGGISVPATTIMAEYTPSGQANIGARMYLGPAFSVDVALMNLKDFSAGVSFRF